MSQSSATSEARPRGLRALGALPGAVAVFILVNGLYIALVALGNITDYDTNFAFVQHVLAMDTTNFGAPEGEGLNPAVMWRAIEAPALWHAGYIAIIVVESLAAILLIVSVIHFLRAIFGTASYAAARRWGSLGLTLIVLLFVGGFIALGGEWFNMWRSVAWNGLDAAIRNAMLAGISLILLHLPSKAWGEE